MSTRNRNNGKFDGWKKKFPKLNSLIKNAQKWMGGISKANHLSLKMAKTSSKLRVCPFKVLLKIASSTMAIKAAVMMIGTPVTHLTRRRVTIG